MVLKLLGRACALGMIAVMSMAGGEPLPPDSPPATDDVLRLRCDYQLKIDRKLANGTPETANVEKTDQLYVFDFSTRSLWRQGSVIPSKVTDTEVTFSIGQLKYRYDRGSMRLTASSYVSTPGGTSTVTVDGLCKSEVPGVFSPTATSPK